MSLAVGVAAVVLYAGALDAAKAQQPRRGETVTERARPELDPLNVRIDGFLFAPKLEVTEKYNDNIFAADTGTVDDFITTVSPSLSLKSDWNRHSLAVDGQFTVVRFLDNPSENYVDFSLNGNGRIDVLRNTFITAGTSFSRLHEDRGSPDDADGIEPTEYELLVPTLGVFNRWNRVSLNIDATARRYNYDDVKTTTGVVNNDDRDRYHYELTFRGGYEIVPEYEAFVRLSINTVNYDDSTDDAGVNRDSDGYEMVVGTRIDFSGITFGDVFVGYRAQDFDDPTLKTVEGPSFGGAITWNVTGLTTVKGSVTRSIEESTLTGASGFFATVATASVDHELLRNLLIGGDISYTLDDYEGITREDNLYHVGIYGRYLMSRNLYLSVTYDYDQRDSNEAGNDYDKNVFMVRLETQL